MSILKEVARRIIFIAKRKPYKKRVNEDIVEFSPIKRDDNREFFFGYYDKSPENNGRVLFHEMLEREVNIIVRDIATGKETVVGKSKAYNWQMGARALWIDSDTVSWNDFDGDEYVCKWFSLSKQRIVRTIPMAVMDYVGGNYALGTNWQRLITVNPDYSYSCLPKMEYGKFYDYANDGIWMYDLKKKEKVLLLSIADVLKCRGKRLYTQGEHCINHIMVNPSGTAFMFIHRYKYEGKKYDRLMCYDFKTLRCLLDDPVQSHFCWVDDNNLMGYCEHDAQIGWYSVNIISGEISKLNTLTCAHPKNGHPTINGDWIVIDSYPDLSRMQSLIAYNHQSEKIVWLGDFYHDMKHHNYNRCDLHPKFTKDGDKVYIDTIYNGRRELCAIEIKLTK